MQHSGEHTVKENPTEKHISSLRDLTSSCRHFLPTCDPYGPVFCITRSVVPLGVRQTSDRHFDINNKGMVNIRHQSRKDKTLVAESISMFLLSHQDNTSVFTLEFESNSPG